MSLFYVSKAPELDGFDTWGYQFGIGGILAFKLYWISNSESSRLEFALVLLTRFEVSIGFSEYNPQTETP